jgi:serine protease
MTFPCASRTNASLLESNAQGLTALQQSTALDTRLTEAVASTHRSRGSAWSTGNGSQCFNLRQWLNRAVSLEPQSVAWEQAGALVAGEARLGNSSGMGRRSRSLTSDTQITPTFSNSSTTLANRLDPAGTLLSPTSTANTLTVNTQLIAGTLRADRFTVSSNVSRTVLSGNGNVDFGSGFRDTLDLSNVFSTSVNFNLTSTQTGGVAFNTGTGTRIFDAINFQNGRQILFEGIDQVRFADGVLNLSVTPNDPLFSQQWNLHMMGVQNAWRFTTGSSRVAIGIQDTGLGVDAFGQIHPDLRSNNTWVYGDFKDDFFTVGRGWENNSHSTAVQGIIAAASNNQFGMSGINWNSRTINIDVLGGQATDFSLEGAAQTMINDANSLGQRIVINMSLGALGTFDRNVHFGLEQVVRNNPNTLFVIAAGNEGNRGVSGISSPAVLAKQYSNVVAVGASTGYFDSNGISRTPGDRLSYSQYGSGLTLMGPAEVITTRASLTPTGAATFGYYSNNPTLPSTQVPQWARGFDGTSAATPNVTGVASLVWSANPNLTAGQVKGILAQTAVDLGPRGYDLVTGSGFVNADAAVRRAMAIARGFTA